MDKGCHRCAESLIQTKPFNKWTFGVQRKNCKTDKTIVRVRHVDIFFDFSVPVQHLSETFSGIGVALKSGVTNF